MFCVNYECQMQVVMKRIDSLNVMSSCFVLRYYVFLFIYYLIDREYLNVFLIVFVYCILKYYYVEWILNIDYFFFFF